MTGANAKVKDPEFCNWLKVCLALHYLKAGLSPFVQDVVDEMHRFILQKLYNASTVPATLCYSCDTRYLRHVELNRNQYTWKFPNPCPFSLCDTFLRELFALHSDPETVIIYIENCDVSAWPNSSWECAKFYMPRGQKCNKTGPAQSDSQALLTLMTNCRFFWSKLTKGFSNQAKKVSTIRNKVMHSGDMTLSDDDRTRFITDIIKLLEDHRYLRSLDECQKAVIEINKINTYSLEVFFSTDMEMKALAACFEDLKQELGIQRVEIEKTVESLKENIKGFQKEIKDKVGDIDAKCQKMGAEVNKLSRTMTSGLKYVKGQVRTQSAKAKQTYNLLKRKALPALGQQKKKVRKLEKEMQLIKECESQALVATAGQVSEMIMESDVRVIQQLFIDAYKGVQIISVNAVLDNASCWKDLEDFYTDIVIEEEEEESTQRIKNKQQLKKAVTSFRQIFEKCDRKVTRIILQAPAGQGKSTFCRKVVHTWCSVQKKQLNIPIDDGTSDRSETIGLKHEDELLRFDVLLYICLRDISDAKTLMDVIHAQFPLDETQIHMSHIETLIGQAESNKVLLIMDGLDEMDISLSFIGKIMRRELYPNLSVLATTRSWKIGELRLIRSAHFDLLLDLQGFSFDNSMLFAKKLFDSYNKDESAIAQFKEYIFKNDVIRSLIHVPLLLLFIVQVWCDRKSFPQTIYELYLEMLDVIVNRYMNGKKRIEKNQGKQDQKWPLESTTFNANPKLSKLSLVKHFGADFLAALCEVANHFLMKACRETSLVFDEEVLLELLGKEGTSKLQTALDLGILSKSESRSTFHEKIRLTFLHKTVQEFLAAINICCREDRCNMFLDSLKTCDDVLQNEQIIKFAAGISTTQCQKIFEKIYEVCDKDRRSVYLMHSLSRIYIDCIRETSKETLSLKFFCVYANQMIWNKLQSALKVTLKVRIHLKYLHLQSCILNDAEFNYFEFQCLTKLTLYDMTVKGKLLLSKCTHLKCLDLDSCTLDDDVLDLSESICLEDIRLTDVTMKGKLLLSKCTHLRCLNLNNCTLDDDVLDLSESICLEDISLTNVTMKGKLLLSKCTHLKRLNLNNCTLDDAVLDLSESICLEYISLTNVTMMSKLLLSKCTHLSCLNLNNCTLDDAVLDLSESICLEYISLTNVTMMGKLLLSKCTHLKYLKLASCMLELAQFDLSESSCLERFFCNKVTLTGRGRLLCTQLINLMLVNCNLSEFTLDISSCPIKQIPQLQNTSMENANLNDALLSLDNVNNFMGLTLDNVTMSKECKEVFCNSLSQCKELVRLSIKNVDLCDALLSLVSVKYLNLDNVTMNKECKEVFCNSLSQCKELERLSIKNVDLCDALLSLVSVKNVNLDNVTMSKECKDMFCNSLSQCKELKTLSIKNVDLCNALLSLDSKNYIWELSLDNVTMSKECKEVFCNSLSQCKELESLSIKNVDLCDALLSLVSVNHLNLDNVTMSKECKEVFCNSLSQCKELRSLSIKNVDLCNALLSLDSENYILKLSLDNVTMSKECKEVFCNSLSQCKELRSLSIKNVDLCDALLSLVSVKNVNLDNVTMSKECKDMFCNSLSQCKELKTLSIKNVDLCNALLSLDSENYIWKLSLDNVTMSKECKEVFCNSLSQCKELVSLSIKDVDLCNALLSLDSENYIWKLSLDNVTMSKECKEVFCNSLSQCKELVSLSIKDVDLCNALLSLDSENYILKLSLDNVTMSKECKEVFCNSLSQCKELRSLSIKNVDLCDALLSLVSVKNVNLDNVTMSKECKDMFCNSLSQCKELKTLSIKNVDLCNALLSLDSENYIWKLSLDNVTMSKECKEVFCNSLSQCKELVSLSIKDVDLCNALLSLDSENYIWKLSLDNVTMSKECKEVFCNSLSQCKELVSLSIKDVDLCNALLSLDSENYILKLSLDNVTMSKECKEVFCNSLSQCKELRSLSIKNVDLCDALLRLVSVKYLNLDNVTMSKECKEVFCNRISQCKNVQSISIKNMVLCGGLHEMHNMKGLNYITLEGVKIGTLDKVLMCKSLCQCTQLKNLSLKNLDLGDGLLNLNNLGILSSLTFDNVTMCKDGYLMLCRSISTCKHLKLSLKNLDLGHAILSLDNLEEFELVNITMSLECVDYIKSTEQCLLFSCFKTAQSIEMIANSRDKFVVNYKSKRDHDLDDDDNDDDDDDYVDDDDDDYVDDLDDYDELDEV